MWTGRPVWDRRAIERVRVMIFKRCKYESCKNGKWRRCRHPEWVQVVGVGVDGRKVKLRGPVERYLFLWVGPAGKRDYPKTKDEVFEFERAIKVWIGAGMPGGPGGPSGSGFGTIHQEGAPSSTNEAVEPNTPTTAKALINAYAEGHVKELATDT